jgi:hypothetical protein
MSDIVERLKSVAVSTEQIAPWVEQDNETILLAATEIARLRTELAEAHAAREQTIKNWEADIRAMNANRDTLRTELAEAQAEIEAVFAWDNQHPREQTRGFKLSEYVKTRLVRVWQYNEQVDKREVAEANRDTLRQQLAVAREGLGIIEFEARHPLKDFQSNALLRIKELARDTLAKLGQMGEQP